MKFQSEKKELWRYASKNLTAPVRGTNRQLPLPHRLPHQRLPQSREFVIMTQYPQQKLFLEYCDGYGGSSSSSNHTRTIYRQENVNTPPPPYSSLSELDYSSNATMPLNCLNFHQHQTYLIDGKTETPISAKDSDAGFSRKQVHSRDGCNYVNTGGTVLADEYEKPSETTASSSHELLAELQKKARQTSSQPKHLTNFQTVGSSTTSFASTAAKILRNCCGGTFGFSNSVLAPSNTNINNNNTIANTCSKLNYQHSKSGVDHLDNSSSNYLPEQYFTTLIKQLKASQISSLLKAVKSRHDQVIPLMPSTSKISSTSSQRYYMANCQTNCILIRRAEILGEEPYVIACRLFFWRDLKNSSQLKRLPVCPNERDPVYVCCNPLHWCRILETGANSQSGINSTYFGSTDPDNIRQNYSNLRVVDAESVTTDGEGRCCPSNWCEVAYWEMAQRVGERFLADTPVINIFSDNPYKTTGDHKDGMCLKDLIEKRTTPSPDDVQYTRQKIGLGITLSQESDGVWLFNRSTVPVFVHSPTLTESWYRVCRVEPGDCLRAFDKYRAQTWIHPGQFPILQTGPIDKFSMRISFGKGWGYSYKRPDVTLCPCWLEVLFQHPR